MFSLALSLSRSLALFFTLYSQVAQALVGIDPGLLLQVLRLARNRATHYPLYTSLCTGELNAIRTHKCFLCSPFYVKGVSLGHVRRN